MLEMYQWNLSISSIKPIRLFTAFSYGIDVLIIIQPLIRGGYFKIESMRLRRSISYVCFTYYLQLYKHMFHASKQWTELFNQSL